MSSVACLVMLAIQRVIAIRSLDASNSSVFSPIKVLAYMVILWILMISYHLLPAFGVWGKVGHKPQPSSPLCTIVKRNQDIVGPDTVLDVFGYLLPLLTLIICYCLMFKQMNNFSFKTDKEGQLSKSALLMIGSFVVIYAPGFLDYFFNDLSKEGSIPALTIVAYVCSWSHAFINPIIMMFCNKMYHDQFLIVLKIKEDDKRTSTFNSRGSVRKSSRNSLKITNTRVSIIPMTSLKTNGFER